MVCASNITVISVDDLYTHCVLCGYFMTYHSHTIINQSITDNYFRDILEADLRVNRYKQPEHVIM